MTTDLPTTTSEITAEWMTEALQGSGTIGPDERLIIRYRTQLDGDTQDGIALTNVAGAIQWFNGDDSNPDRIPYSRTLTDGTVGTPDHEDAQWASHYRPSTEMYFHGFRIPQPITPWYNTDSGYQELVNKRDTYPQSRLQNEGIQYRSASRMH